MKAPYSAKFSDQIQGFNFCVTHFGNKASYRGGKKKVQMY